MGQRDLNRIMHISEKKSPSLGRLHSFRRFRQGSFKRRKRSFLLTHRRTNLYKMTEGGVQHSGYIDIKQPPKVKGRKLKSWRKKWVVLHEMSIRSASDRSAAKVDVYADEKTAVTSPADKHTFILEFVSDVRQAKSKTHNQAFEIVESEPVLLLSGATELETQTWMAAFKKIFWPGKVDNDTYPVEILDNDHSDRLGLRGSYQMSVNPEVVAIHSEVHNSYEWSLNMLKRFHLEQNTEHTLTEILVIESGPRSECGEAVFKFSSDHGSQILQSIKRNIFVAINLKKNESKSKPETSPSDKQHFRASITSGNSGGSGDRARSETCSSAEQRYRDLLENTAESKSEKQTVSRMSSVMSEESAMSDEPPEIPKKKRQSVTFDTSGLNDTKAPPTDILCAPIEIIDSEATDYNRVDFNSSQSSPKTIITTFTVAKPGYETKILLDDHGYSHVDMSNSKPVISADDKTRSLSNLSSHSSFSCRSASVGSKDSGIPNSADKPESEQCKRGTSLHRSTNSFDSAVSTSSTVDTTETPTLTSNTTHLTVEIQEVEISEEELKMVDKNKLMPAETAIYQDVSIEEGSESQNKDKVYAKPALKKSSSTGNFKSENEYEDLNVYRKGKKNLIKHLGMDPFVDPSSVPPSLPERPSSHKLRRKSYTHDKRIFTLPFRSKKKMRERAASISSSSSGSDDGNRDHKKKDMSLKVWPLGNKSVIAGNDELYQPVAIQRFLRDNEEVVGPHKRERSSSLNLNTANLTMKRPSIQSVQEFSVTDRKNAMWKHNRNASMQMDMLGRLNDPDATSFNIGRGHVTDLSLRPEMVSNGTFSDLDISDDGKTQAFEEEPIYAELEPTKQNLSNCYGNPFPDLTVWKPADISDVAEVSELNGTNYENDDSLDKGASSDVFNQGFVVDDNKENQKMSDSSAFGDLLIDLSDSSEARDSRVFADIFNMGVGPSYFDSKPLLPQSHCMTSFFNTVSTAPTAGDDVQAASESIYMDMTSCKNESIYVLPSSIKPPEPAETN